MKHSLVLQFPENFFQHDQLIRFENMLDKLTDIAKLDGHDIGSNELNFFIFTDDAKLTFDAIKLAIPRSLLRGHIIEGRVRETAGFSDEQSSSIPRQLATGRSLKAAYREVDGEEYHILYPSNLKNFHIS